MVVSSAVSYHPNRLESESRRRWEAKMMSEAATVTLPHCLVSFLSSTP